MVFWWGLYGVHYIVDLTLKWKTNVIRSFVHSLKLIISVYVCKITWIWGTVALCTLLLQQQEGDMKSDTEWAYKQTKGPAIIQGWESNLSATGVWSSDHIVKTTKEGGEADGVVMLPCEIRLILNSRRTKCILMHPGIFVCGTMIEHISHSINICHKCTQAANKSQDEQSRCLVPRTSFISGNLVLHFC